MYFRVSALKNFAKFTGKRLSWSVFLINMQAWRPTNFTKIRLQYKFFSCDISKNFKNAFLYRTRPVAASGTILWTLSLLHLRTRNGVISWYVWALQRLFHSTACVSFLSISFFLIFFSWILLLFGFEVSFSILKIKQLKLFLGS